mmetsp:Transcript_13589/g.25460  ORF Transcript_13589/g.25460 Transcript_13589/m.25460 type:complete len:198 (+) Transcript_13589:179-772(+)
MGYSPFCWRRGNDLILYKVLGNFNVTNTRPILLFEVDANQHNKSLGRLLMHEAEMRNGLPWEQYGRRKGHLAEVQALNNTSFFDLLRLQCHAAAFEICDLKSNYNLVVHSIATLLALRQHVSEAPMFCSITTLQDMVHTCLTTFGQSDEQYGGDLWAVPLGLPTDDRPRSTRPPPQDLGQGSGTAPQLWAVVSTPIS